MENLINKLNNNEINIDFNKVSIIKDDNGEVYYVKKESNWFTEILSEKIAEFYEIPVVHHRKVNVNGEPGLISKDFHKPGYKYYDGEDLLNSQIDLVPGDLSNSRKVDYSNNLETLWWALEKRYKDNPNKENIIKTLMGEFTNLYEFQIITGQSDLHVNNYQIEENETSVHLAPLFDNAFSFVNNPHLALSLEYEDSFSYIQDSLSKYFDYITNEQRENFMEKVKALTIEELNRMINEILRQENISKSERNDIEFEKNNIIKTFLLSKKSILEVNKNYLSNRMQK